MKLNDFLRILHGADLVDVEVPNANKNIETNSANYYGCADDALQFYKDDDINVSDVDCEVRYRLFCEPYPLEDEDDDGTWNVTYNIPLELFNRVGTYAYKTGITPNDVVRMALENFLESRE